MVHALIFDSGVGGLSVVAEIRKLLPDVSLTYAADDAFRPYGDKTEAALRTRLPGLLWTLSKTAQPDLVVIACNTASTTALEGIRTALSVPVIGVVPAIKPAAQQSRTKTIGVLGTPGTVRRKYVDALIQKFASDCHVVLQGSVGLVDLAERKLAGELIDPGDIRREIAPLFSGPHGPNIDQIVLACTHFPLLREELSRAAPHEAAWIDSGAAIAKRMQTVMNGLAEIKPRAQTPDTALLVGPDASTQRAQTFAAYGFLRTAGLEP